MMRVPAIADSKTLKAVTISRLSADAGMVGAKAALWRLMGYGLLAAGVGAGVGTGVLLGFLGYSYVTDSQAAAEKIADAISNALAKTPITASGVVKLADGGQVELKPGGVVSLQPDASVKLDPASRVRVEISQLPSSILNSTSGKTTAGEVIKKQVTVFLSLDHSPGEVTTGWRFLDGHGGEPVDQYCYYLFSNGDVTSTKVDIASNGVRKPNIPGGSVPDLERALGKCQWFKAGGP
jgi:hypothetical protein